MHNGAEAEDNRDHDHKCRLHAQMRYCSRPLSMICTDTTLQSTRKRRADKKARKAAPAAGRYGFSHG